MMNGGFEVKEAVINISASVLGHDVYWIKGVSGTALSFDGYFSDVQLPGEYSPPLADEFTL